MPGCVKEDCYCNNPISTHPCHLCNLVLAGFLCIISGLNLGKSQVQIQWWHHGGLLKSHYNTLHHLQAELALKLIYLHMHFWDIKLSAPERPHVNELCLTLLKVAFCIKLLPGDLSLHMLQMTHTSVSPPCPHCLSHSLPLFNICHELERASHQLCCSLTLLPAYQPVFSAPLNLIAASFYRVCTLPCHFLVAWHCSNTCRRYKG